jgi:hypothetical protein
MVNANIRLFSEKTVKNGRFSTVTAKILDWDA